MKISGAIFNLVGTLIDSVAISDKSARKVDKIRKLSVRFIENYAELKFNIE